MKQRRAALFGATSRIGPGIVSAFLDDSSVDASHLVLILRPSSKRPDVPPESGKHISIHTLASDDPSVQELSDAFREIDCSVVISALNAALVDLHKRLADACVAADVSRFIPADYGSVRSDDPWALDLIATYRNKAIVRWHCQRLADDHPSFSWTSIATGHFFDYGLHTDLLGFNVKRREARLFDGGDIRWSASTTRQVGRAVVKTLANEASTANQMLLVQSFCVTQNEVIAAVEEITGKKLKRTRVDGHQYLLDEAAKGEEGDADAVEEAVAVCGILRSNWEGKAEFANEKLALEEEDLLEVVKRELGV